ncbi:penicillin-binding transpeptidase domain-containing protein [Actinacidiphila glaucinigra]|uniref:penicillin-binding transpeptidase domain-containing protein n=1 Tax=Actinacidiphila glaucinigra TaxID=235986 RepID=UPI00371099B9
MIPYARRAAALCLLLLVALLVNAIRIQVVRAPAYNADPANRRVPIERYGQPRGDILVGGRPVTGSRSTGAQLDWVRTYADGPLYAPVTGFSSQTYGTALLEGAEDDILSGSSPGLSALPLWNAISRQPQRPGHVRTTIDPAVQKAAYKALGDKKGAVAALDPATGRILALVSTPSYDPGTIAGTGPKALGAWRRLVTAEDQPMLNRALRQTYPPGSTFKTVTAVAALVSGVVTDVDRPTDSPDPYPLPGSTTSLGNESASAGCEDAPLRYAYVVSCNTVFGKLGDDVGLRAMRETAEAFGFNDPSIGVPSHPAVSVFDRRMDRAQLALSSIGQYDTRATPLQMAMVAAAVANDGTLMYPHLVERTTDSAGLPLEITGQRAYRQVMDAAVAFAMQDMMVAVVRHGTGRNAALPGALVGGKTGTAQHGEDNRGNPFAWFISWAKQSRGAPAEVAVAVVVEDAAADRADISGGGKAAPVARAVMRAVLGP